MDVVSELLEMVSPGYPEICLGWGLCPLGWLRFVEVRPTKCCGS